MTYVGKARTDGWEGVGEAYHKDERRGKGRHTGENEKLKVPINVLVISLASNDFLVGAVSILLWICRCKSRSSHVSYVSFN